jgi:hypothetical protein
VFAILSEDAARGVNLERDDDDDKEDKEEEDFLLLMFVRFGLNELMRLMLGLRKM